MKNTAKIPLHIKDIDPKNKKQVDAFYKREIEAMKSRRCPTCGEIRSIKD